MIPAGKLKAELRKCSERNSRKEVQAQDQNWQGNLVSSRGEDDSLNFNTHTVAGMFEVCDQMSGIPILPSARLHDYSGRFD